MSSKLYKSGGDSAVSPKGGSFLKFDVEGYEEHVLRHLLEDCGYAVMPLAPRDFLALAAPPYELGSTISFVEGGNAGQYKSGSWSYAEDWGTWTTGRRVHLVLPLPEVPRSDLILAGLMKAHVNDKNPVTFEIKNPVSPAELGLSGDQRSLGLGVRELMVREF